MRTATALLFTLALFIPSLSFAEAPPQYLMQWGTAGSEPGQFNHPIDIATGPDGSIYVADYGNHRIQKFTASGQYLLEWGSYGTAPGQFNLPEGLCTDPFGNVYVVDTGNDRVQKFTSSGAFLLQWSAIGVAPGQFQRPMAVAADGNGYVYVSDYANERIYKFDASGTYILTFAPAYGNGNYPCDGLAVTSSGLVYATAVDVPTKLINVFTASGNYDNAFGCGGGYPTQCAMSHPNDVDVDAQGNFYVIDNDWWRVVKWSPGGQVLTTWGTGGTGNGQFGDAYGIAVAPNGWVYVGDFGLNRIQVFGDAATPTTKSTWGHLKSLYR